MRFHGYSHKTWKERDDGCSIRTTSPPQWRGEGIWERRRLPLSLMPVLMWWQFYQDWIIMNAEWYITLCQPKGSQKVQEKRQRSEVKGLLLHHDSSSNLATKIVASNKKLLLAWLPFSVKGFTKTLAMSFVHKEQRFITRKAVPKSRGCHHCL